MRNRSGIWTGKTWLAIIAVLVGAIAIVTYACTPAGPTTVVNINTNTNTLSGGQSGTDPNDPSKVAGSVTADTKSVTVNGFVNGEKCQSGISPANDNHKIRLGCDLAVTVNPRDKDGKVIQDPKAPPVDYFILATGQDVVTFTQSASNGYNGDVHSVKAGKFALIASVVGVSSGLQEFEVIP